MKNIIQSKTDRILAGMSFGIAYAFIPPCVLLIWYMGAGHGTEFPMQFFLAPKYLTFLIWPIVFALSLWDTRKSQTIAQYVLIGYYLALAISIPFLSDRFRLPDPLLFVALLFAHAYVQIVLWRRVLKRKQSAPTIVVCD
jgi:hypothetical protein